MREYLRYMALKRQHPKDSLVPSAAVDAVWHVHILCTKEYAAFCERNFGHFVHHDPLAGKVKDYLATLKAYAEAFGEDAPTVFWEPPPVGSHRSTVGVHAAMPAPSEHGSGSGAGSGNEYGSGGGAADPTPVKKRKAGGFDNEEGAGSNDQTHQLEGTTVGSGCSCSVLVDTRCSWPRPRVVGELVVVLAVAVESTARERASEEVVGCRGAAVILERARRRPSHMDRRRAGQAVDLHGCTGHVGHQSLVLLLQLRPHPRVRAARPQGNVLREWDPDDPGWLPSRYQRVARARDRMPTVRRHGHAGQDRGRGRAREELRLRVRGC